VERERLLEAGFGEGNSILEENDDLRYDDAVVEQAVNASLVKAQLNLKRSHRKSHGIIAFKELALTVSERWKKLSPEGRAVFEKYAEIERTKYKRQVAMWQSARSATQSPNEVEQPPSLPSTDEEAFVTEHPSLVSPIVEEPVKPRKILDDSRPYLPAFATNNSLHSMMARGYSSFMEQKKAELELRTSMIDHMEMMMGYPPQDATASLDLYGSSAYPYTRPDVANTTAKSCGVTTYQSPPDHGNHDYYSMAESTFQLAQRTLPPQSFCSGAAPAGGALAYAPVSTSHQPHGVGLSYMNSSASSYAQGSRQDLYLFHQGDRYDNGALYGAFTPGSPHGSPQQTLTPAVTVTMPVSKPSVRSLPSGCGVVEFDFDAALDDSDEDDDEDFREDDSDSIMGLLNCNAEPVSLVSIFDH
jgi:hypothetical protein